MYTQQYRHYPGCVYNFAGNAAVIWPTRLRPFLGGQWGVFHCPARGPRPAAPAR